MTDDQKMDAILRDLFRKGPMKASFASGKRSGKATPPEIKLLKAIFGPSLRGTATECLEAEQERLAKTWGRK